MTGFGAAEAALARERVLRVEIRTVNHRHLSTAFRLPGGWERLDGVVAARVRAALKRGRVSVSARCGDGEKDGTAPLRLDEEQVARAVELLRRACASLGIDDRLDAGDVARLPGAWRTGAGAGEPPAADELAACVDRALGRVVEMRTAEGMRLADALRGSLESIAGAVDRIERRAPERLRRQRDRLREQVRELADGVEADPDRLAREIAHLAAKWDVAEEIVRLRSHAELFLATLDSDGERPAGKRLEFVAQEMNREANTIGSKANDAAVAEAVVGIKEELERVREQAENVE